MTSINNLMKNLSLSYTPYHAVARAAAMLEEAGYVRLEESTAWELCRGGKYYVIRDGSALIAFHIGKEGGGFKIVASHTDSPCLKVKGNAALMQNGYAKLNVERYGGGLNYSWLDIPLRLAGRIVTYDAQTGELVAKTVESAYTTVIPSVAIHFSREANSNLTLNPQVDLQPILSLDPAFALCEGDGAVERDLFVVNASEPYLAGAKEEFLVSPRIDNLVSAFASVEALASAGDSGISVACLMDNEEVGSRTKQGAGSDFLSATISRIAEAFGEKRELMLSQSFLVSCDGAHAIHPNHPEKSDAANPVRLGGGVVVKHHANQNYTTDAFSSAFIKTIFGKANVPFQDFYMRADMPCGSTLGAISSSAVSVRSVDIGVAQLAMHSATETMATADYGHLVDALAAFYATKCAFPSYDRSVIEG